MFPLGETASLATAACWAVGLTLYRRPATTVGGVSLNLFKNTTAAVLFVLTLLVVGCAPIAWKDQAFLAASGIVGLAIGDTFFMNALARLGAHRTALFGCLGPVLTAIFAWLLRDESLTLVQIGGVAGAGVGVTLVLRSTAPGRRAEGAASIEGVLYGVGGAFCHSAGVLLSKDAFERVDPLSGSAVRMAAAAAFLVLLALWGRRLHRQFAPLLRGDLLRQMVPAVLIGTYGGIFLMSLGIKHAPSAVANALHSTTPLFTLPITLFVLRQRVGRLAVLGSFVAVAGVVLLFLPL